MKIIMVVDDNQAINGMLNEKLNEEGYDVISAYSGTEAKMNMMKQLLMRMNVFQ